MPTATLAMPPSRSRSHAKNPKQQRQRPRQSLIRTRALVAPTRLLRPWSFPLLRLRNNSKPSLQSPRKATARGCCRQCRCSAVRAPKTSTKMPSLHAGVRSNGPWQNTASKLASSTWSLAQRSPASSSSLASASRSRRSRTSATTSPTQWRLPMFVSSPQSRASRQSVSRCQTKIARSLPLATFSARPRPRRPRAQWAWPSGATSTASR